MTDEKDKCYNCGCVAPESLRNSLRLCAGCWQRYKDMLPKGVKIQMERHLASRKVPTKLED